MRFVLPIILILISFAVFFVFTSPLYNDIQKLRLQVGSYNEALDNSKALENERDKLTAKFNSINPENLMKLQKLLPENVDNIRLILEIEQLALPYGMVLKNVKYSTVTDKNAAKNAIPGGATETIQGTGTFQQFSNKDYGTWDLEFSTSGSYNNFLNFTRDLEKNLRIVDISSIQFSSGNSAPAGIGATPSVETYQYNFKIKTYWLKN